MASLNRREIVSLCVGACVGVCVGVCVGAGAAYAISRRRQPSATGAAEPTSKDTKSSDAATATPKDVSVSEKMGGPAPISVRAHTHTQTRALPDTEELRAEQLSRNRQFFGDGQFNIERAYVVVVGVGGVGSHAAHMLVRAGVAHIRMIDFDNVSLSSLNRHATARRPDVGVPKVEAMKRAFAEIAPSCVVEAVPRMFEAAHAHELLLSGGRPDFVIDCIDDRDTKAALLCACRREGLRVVSSLGAGGKADPTAVRIADLANIKNERMANVLRQTLRRLGVEPSPQLARAAASTKSALNGGDNAALDDGLLMYDIPCAYSIEVPRATLLPLEMNAAAGETPADFGALAGFRVRIMPVLGTMPAIFGQTLAAYVLCTLAGSEHELEPLEAAPLAIGTLRTMSNAFTDLERTVYSRLHTSLSLEDVDFVVNAMWHGRSAVSMHRHGQKGVELRLDVYQPHRPATPANMLVLTKDQLEEYAPVARAASAAAAADLPSSSTEAERLAAQDAAVDAVLRETFGEHALARVHAQTTWARTVGYY